MKRLSFLFCLFGIFCLSYANAENYDTRLTEAYSYVGNVTTHTATTSSAIPVEKCSEINAWGIVLSTATGASPSVQVKVQFSHDGSGDWGTPSNVNDILWLTDFSSTYSSNTVTNIPVKWARIYAISKATETVVVKLKAFTY